MQKFLLKTDGAVTISFVRAMTLKVWYLFNITVIYFKLNFKFVTLNKVHTYMPYINSTFV